MNVIALYTIVLHLINFPFTIRIKLLHLSWLSINTPKNLHSKTRYILTSLITILMSELFTCLFENTLKLVLFTFSDNLFTLNHTLIFNNSLFIFYKV